MTDRGGVVESILDSVCACDRVLSVRTSVNFAYVPLCVSLGARAIEMLDRGHACIVARLVYATPRGWTVNPTYGEC